MNKTISKLESRRQDSQRINHRAENIIDTLGKVPVGRNKRVGLSFELRSLSVERGKLYPSVQKTVRLINLCMSKKLKTHDSKVAPKMWRVCFIKDSCIHLKMNLPVHGCDVWRKCVCIQCLDDALGLTCAIFDREQWFSSISCTNLEIAQVFQEHNSDCPSRMVWVDRAKSPLTSHGSKCARW
jgi:hypothetical protein